MFSFRVGVALRSAAEASPNQVDVAPTSGTYLDTVRQSPAPKSDVSLARMR
jgi:hypothetical protein